MSTQKPSKKELIKKIATEVEDPELREQLIDALLEHEEPSYHSWDSRPHMAVHPDAVPSNVRLHKWVNAIVGVVFFSIVLTYLKRTPETDTSYSFLQFMLFFVPLLALLQHNKLCNVSKWQRRGRKPPRKFWGAMIEPSIDKK